MRDKQQQQQSQQQSQQQEPQQQQQHIQQQQQQQQQPNRRIDKRWRRPAASASRDTSKKLESAAEEVHSHAPFPPLPEDNTPISTSPLTSSTSSTSIPATEYISSTTSSTNTQDEDTSFVGECDMPTTFGQFRMRGYRSHMKAFTKSLEPVVIVYGDIRGKENVIVRVHDQCLTGEVFGSLRCDCREQLQESLRIIRQEGGLVIYLQQEGRGIGIANKIAAYSLQDDGMDTVDANTHLGFKDEMREYHAVKDILNDLNIQSIQLVTNNPFKIDALRALGVIINERISIEIPENAYNGNYLKSKRDRMNHLIMHDDNNPQENVQSENYNDSNSNRDYSYDNRDIKDDAQYEVEREEKTDIFDVKGGQQNTGAYVFGKDSVELAIESIRQGKLVLVVDDEGRENEGDLILAAELATPETVGFMVRYTSGVLCVSMESDRLDELKLPPMVTNNEDPKETAYAVSVDYKHGTTTGISAADRAATFRALADYSCTANDFQRPGHVFPLRYKEGGVLTRAGHTEATIDLVRLAGLKPIGVLSEVVNDDGSIKRLSDLKIMAAEHNIVMTSVADLIAYRLEQQK